MFGSVDPKKLEKLMKRMNIQTETIKAIKVTIETEESNIIITNPEVMVADIMGRRTYQITGNESVEPRVRDEDVKLVMEKTGRSKDDVVKKLKELNNDIARAIIELKREELGD